MSDGRSGRFRASPSRSGSRRGQHRSARAQSAASEIVYTLSRLQSLALVEGHAQASRRGNCRNVPATVSHDFFLGLVVGVAPVLPGDAFDLVLAAVDLDPDAILSKAGDAGDRAVDPSAIGVVAQQHDLGAGLQSQRGLRRLGALIEVAGDARGELAPGSGQRLEICDVDAPGSRVGG